MSDKTNIERKVLTDVVNLVKPALSTAAYIPALTHIRFDGEYATAYNDITAISVRFPLDHECCLPGDLLARTLNSFAAPHVALQKGMGTEVVISSGRSKIKMPTLPVDQFPYTIPDDDASGGFDVTAEILKGIDRCLVSVGNDPTHPAQMGITLDVDDDGHAVLFSTDNFSISRYQTKSKVKLPGDSPVILPTFFCSQLLILGKAFPDAEIDLSMVPGGVLATIGRSKAFLFSKTMVDLEPLDFPKIVNDHVKLSGLKGRAGALPDSWEGSIQRALLVVASEVDKSTKFTADGEDLKMVTTSPLGEAIDTVSLEVDQFPKGAFHVDPSLIARASKVCSLIELGERTLILADAEAKFVHLIAHNSK